MFKTKKEKQKIENKKEKLIKEEQKKLLIDNIKKCDYIIIELKENKEKIIEGKKVKLELLSQEKNNHKGVKTKEATNERDRIKEEEKEIKEIYLEKIKEINIKIKETEELKIQYKLQKQELEQKKEKVEIYEENDEENENDINPIIEIHNNPKINLECKIIKNNNNVISKIIHMADIHIRLSSLHKKYDIVFNKLYNKINEIKEPTLIIICGDILNDCDNNLNLLLYLIEGLINI